MTQMLQSQVSMQTAMVHEELARSTAHVAAGLREELQGKMPTKEARAALADKVRALRAAAQPAPLAGGGAR